MQNDMKVRPRLRFSPSPTGCLHLGGVRTALYNYLYAKKNGGDFILRIEDTDSTRFVPGAEQYIIDTFKWLGLDFDEGPHIGGKYGPYRQSDRKDIYIKYVNQLLDSGKAYYAFDTKDEIDALMKLLVDSIHKETDRLIENNIRLLVIGDIKSLPDICFRQIQETMDLTKENYTTSLVLALSYSSKWEIINAIKNITEDISKNKIVTGDINEELFNSYLTTRNIPDPELLIRTSGENRISNFLLWQIAYTELYFTETLWPDFKKEEFFKAIVDYQKRERRFGKTSDQIANNI